MITRTTTSLTGGSASFAFADRVTQSEAMRASLEAHFGRVWADEIDPGSNHNILVFHGMGGQGKTELSQRLEKWITGRLTDHPDWGPPPVLARKPLVVRWDLHQIQGALDVPDLLIGLRQGLSADHRRWKAFDLAFASYLSAVRPGQEIEPGRLGAQRDDLLGVLGALAADLGAANVVTQFSTVVVRSVMDLAITALAERRWRVDHPTLAGILQECARLTSGNQAPELAADVLWLLTELIDQLPPRERPALVVFVDTFERVQEPGNIRAEHDLNNLMVQLPFALFVVTGRNKLDWHEYRDGLACSGPRVWPCLTPDCGTEPHQHQLGRLDRVDTTTLLEGRRWVFGWNLDDDLLQRIVRSTDGWPLHIDTVTKVAQNRTRNGAPLTAETLLGGMPDLVARLIQDMSPGEARAFHAMCLAQSFDESLVAAIGQVEIGVVRACLRKAVVEANDSPTYPYRIHDTIRQLVRDAGVKVQPHWVRQDWQEAARRGLVEAHRRFDAAMEASDDVATVEALSLAIALGVQYDVHEKWVTEGVRTGPTIVGLAPFLPQVPDVDTDSDAVALVQMIQALANKREPHSLDVLRRVFEGSTGVAEQAGRWRAYTLRSTYQQRDAALAQFQDNIDRFPAASAVSLTQYGETLSSMRRFRDAIAFRVDHGLDQGRPGATMRRQLGHLEDVDLDRRFARIAAAKSERFRFELRCGLLGSLSLVGQVPEELVSEYLERGINLGQPARQVEMLALQALASLPDAPAFGAILDRIDRVRSRSSLFVSIAPIKLRALRAILTGDDSDRSALLDLLDSIPDLRPSGWIQTEAYLAMLDIHLPPIATQWPDGEDEAAVTARWQQVGLRLIDRAKRGEIIKPLAQIADWPASVHW